MVVSEKKVI